MSTPDLHRPVHPVRFVTAASLFDGHDASINIMRRILQSQGVEVIHLGHNRSVDEVVTACVQEDVQGVAVSSYQGGHVEYFTYLVDLLRERGAGHVKVFGGGGGVIVRPEIEQLHAYGVTRIFSPHDGQSLGLPGMINTLVQATDVDLAAELPTSLDPLLGGDQGALARVITGIEAGRLDPDQLAELHRVAAGRSVPVLGITGTGGSGKSSLTDELVRRFRLDHEDKLTIAVLAVDPTRRRGGGALLGDRIRMNAIDPSCVYFRSLATRTPGAVVPEGLDHMVAAAKAWGADLVVVETPGIGQGDAAIVDHVDCSLYVMTPEFGAASQLEKIDMLDFADVVAINKFDRRGGDDALHDVRRQLVRNKEAFGSSPDDMPVFGTVASRFNDDGVTALYQELRRRLVDHGLAVPDGGWRARPGGGQGLVGRHRDRAAVAGALPGRGGRRRARPPRPGPRAGRGGPSAPAARRRVRAGPRGGRRRRGGQAARPAGHGRRPARCRGPRRCSPTGRPPWPPTRATSTSPRCAGARW